MITAQSSVGVETFFKRFAGFREILYHLRRQRQMCIRARWGTCRNTHAHLCPVSQIPQNECRPTRDAELNHSNTNASGSGNVLQKVCPFPVNFATTWVHESGVGVVAVGYLSKYPRTSLPSESNTSKRVPSDARRRGESFQHKCEWQWKRFAKGMPVSRQLCYNLGTRKWRWVRRSGVPVEIPTHIFAQ